ncbi:autophagy-related protein 16-1-like [Vespula maculifrons]|uniref:Autophagy-related protein 16-1-like n=1 Tax=Vespula maculifrons TaxID=7453 RepID=A0ABD2C8G4_VESMC
MTYLLDISISNYNNVQQKYREKIEKYTPVAQDVQRMLKQHGIKPQTKSWTKPRTKPQTKFRTRPHTKS